MTALGYHIVAYAHIAAFAINIMRYGKKGGEKNKMMFLVVASGFAFIFMVLMLYCFISLISNFVFGVREYQIKRRYSLTQTIFLNIILPRNEEIRLEKWYVLIAIIVCGLIWMPGFVPLLEDVNIDYDMDNVVVNDMDNSMQCIKIGEPSSISEKYGIPEPYYTNAGKGNKGISELRAVLKGIEMPHGYEEGVWDCSESASYAERILENEGFDTIICGNYSQGHAWVVCRGIWDNNKTCRVAIECINHPYVATRESYRHPEIEHEDIYAAMGGIYPYEWDWWLSK